MMGGEDRRSKPHFDFILLALMYMLVAIGVVMISVATFNPELSADVPLLNRIMNSESGRWQAIFALASPALRRQRARPRNSSRPTSVSAAKPAPA